MNTSSSPLRSCSSELGNDCFFYVKLDPQEETRKRPGSGIEIRAILQRFIFDVYRKANLQA